MESLRSYPDPPLADRHVRLRPWEERDAPCVMAGTGRSRRDALAWIGRQKERVERGHGLTLAIVEEAGTDALGYVGLLRRPKLESGIVGPDVPSGTICFAPQPGSAGIGYWVLEEARGRRLATRAALLLTHWALETGGLVRVEALVDPENLPSCRVVERVGFTREGLLRSYLEEDGRRLDAVVYSMLRSDLDDR